MGRERRHRAWELGADEETIRLDTPRIVDTQGQPAAVIRLTIPRSEIRSVMGPAIGEVIAAVTAQGIGPTGPVFSHHFRLDPRVFDFEVGVLVSGVVAAAGRVKPGELPAATVARTIYRGTYEGLAAAWGEFEAWIAALVGGALVTAAALSVLPWVRFPHDQHAPGALWAFGSAPVAAAAWLVLAGVRWLTRPATP